MKSLVNLWPICFVFANLLVSHQLNENPLSRLATLSCMVELGTFHIDPLVQSNPIPWTGDWAQTPDGHFYSNKAPGPMLMAFPVFWLVDHAVTRGFTNPTERWLVRWNHAPLYNRVLSMAFQVIPFTLLVGAMIRWLQRKSGSMLTTHYCALAILFGNTASLYMNTFFGHGLAAVFLMGFALSLLQQRAGFAGVCIGGAVLCDYACLWLLPAALLSSFLIWKKSYRHWTYWALGLSVPAALWIYYHTVCFGAPWRIALQFQNPRFLDPIAIPNELWGIASWFPRPSVLLQLVFGSVRGVLFTQPWALAILGLAGWKWASQSWNGDDPSIRALLIFSVVGFFSLLWMNASFGAWQGGTAVGPRYLSPILPLFGLAAAWVWPKQSRCMAYGLWGGLAFSLVFYGLVLSTTLYGPMDAPLWPFLFRRFFAGSFHGSLLRVTMIFLGLSGIAVGIYHSGVRT